MPTPKSEKPRATSNSGHNAKFEEIQKKQLEILKQRAQKFSFEDSDDEEIEIDKSHIKNLFKNYQGNEGDVARIAQFFESGENVDCLICKNKLYINSINVLTSVYFRHSASEVQRQDMELLEVLLFVPLALHSKVG